MNPTNCFNPPPCLQLCMFEFSGLNELWLGESLGLWLWYPLHTKPRDPQWSVNMQITPGPWLQPPVHWPLVWLPKMQEEKQDRAVTRSGGDKTSSDPDAGPWPGIVYITQCSVQNAGERIRKHFDTRHHISRGRRGDIVTVSETLRRIQKRWPGENARHNSIHHIIHPSCLRVRMQVVTRPWEAGMLGCITLSGQRPGPDIPVSVSSGHGVNGPTLNWQLSNPFLSARVSGTLFFLLLSTQQLSLKGWASSRRLEEAEWAQP